MNLNYFWAQSTSSSNIIYETGLLSPQFSVTPTFMYHECILATRGDKPAYFPSPLLSLQPDNGLNTDRAGPSLQICILSTIHTFLFYYQTNF